MVGKLMHSWRAASRGVSRDSVFGAFIESTWYRPAGTPNSSWTFTQDSRPGLYYSAPAGLMCCRPGRLEAPVPVMQECCVDSLYRPYGPIEPERERDTTIEFPAPRASSFPA